jgi:hypothetical protein
LAFLSSQTGGQTRHYSGGKEVKNLGRRLYKQVDL